ncbi:MAG: kelch repeat-containing protein, partial [Bacteroidia bacterium]
TSFIFCFLFVECFSQAGEWVWLKGDSVPNQPGNYGVQGVPSPTNNPPSLYEPCEWTDLNGNFWMFGGSGITPGGYYGDLWKYNLLTNEWNWMKGTGITNDPGNYGTQGIPSMTNNPSARSYGAATWIDSLGNLWMFGGLTALNPSHCSDLWKYDISTNEWTWMKGPSVTGQSGIYGTQGMPDSANNPAAKWECVASWTDHNSDLWFFGGFGSLLDDLWKFNIASNQWTWMKGSLILSNPGINGTAGIEDSLNTPGSRCAYSRWKDTNGNLWFFGGMFGSGVYPFNDMWRYNPLTNNWTWMGGNGVTGIYGTKCIASPNNIPAARYENRPCWTDQDGNFWFFGGGNGSGFGAVYNDIWKYCVASNQWIWIHGSSSINPAGNWGTLGVSSATNKPNGRGGGVGWRDNNNNLYIFGGATHHYNSPYYYNDLWKYTIDTTCGVCPTSTGIQENNFTNELLVFPNPTNSSLTISFQSSSKQNIELRIYNTLGKQIYLEKAAIASGKFEKEINVKKLSDGIYFLQVKMAETIISKKVVIQH